MRPIFRCRFLITFDMHPTEDIFNIPVQRRNHNIRTYCNITLASSLLQRSSSKEQYALTIAWRTNTVSWISCCHNVIRERRCGLIRNDGFPVWCGRRYHQFKYWDTIQCTPILNYFRILHRKVIFLASGTKTGSLMETERKWSFKFGFAISSNSSPLWPSFTFLRRLF
jgi:hypothetical protein